MLNAFNLASPQAILRQKWECAAKSAPILFKKVLLCLPYGGLGDIILVFETAVLGRNLKLRRICNE